VPDGICVDAQNAVWFADVPNQWCVRVAEGGTVLQFIELDRAASPARWAAQAAPHYSSRPPQWRGMTDSEMVTPGTGQVLTIKVDVPAAAPSSRSSRYSMPSRPRVEAGLDQPRPNLDVARGPWKFGGGPLE
jgi:hypothetical protein